MKNNNNKTSTTSKDIVYDRLLAAAKNTIAKKHGYPDNILGNRWDYAMMLTHRRKAQIQLYEEVLEELYLNCCTP